MDSKKSLTVGLPSPSPSPSPSSPSVRRVVPLWVELTSGAVGGMFSLAVCHPLDTIRVRLQATNRFNTITECIVSTWTHEGIRGFYRGLSFPLFSQGLQKSAMFGASSTADRTLRHFRPTIQSEVPSWATVALCGAFGGFVNSLICAPIELVRSRLQIQFGTKATSEFSGPFDVIAKTLRSDGLRGMWRGLLPMVYRDVPGCAMWFGVNEFIKSKGDRQSRWTILFAGGCAGVGYWVAAFPQDTIKSRIQTASMTEKTTMSFSQALVQLVRNEGVGRLFRGFPIAVIRGIPGAASTFLAYEEAKKAILARR